MPSFLYFLPNVRGGSAITDEVLRKHGLMHIRDHKDQRLHSRGVEQNGPGGLRGVVIGLAGSWSVEEVKQSTELEWKAFPKAHADCQAWLGWKKDELPSPADLARPNQLEGEWLTLADGEKWLVPIARDMQGVCHLPRAYDLDDETGKLVAKRVRREYAKLWEHANAYFASLMTAMLESIAEGLTTFSYEVPNAEQLVSDALAVNYRVSLRELVTLGVMVDGIFQQVADVLIDSHEDGVKKKSDAATGNG